MAQPLPSRGDSAPAPAPATAAEERRRAFLRTVSHELRTPLNAILGFSEILTSELHGPLGSPQYKEYAGIIHDSGQKLLRLVNQLLEMARLEARPSDLQIRPEPLDAALEDVLASLRPDLDSRGVTVRIARAGELPSVMADPHYLRTVLWNLLHIALTFSPEGGEVRLRAERTVGGVEIVIQDQGDGELPKDQLGLSIADLACKAMSGGLRLARRRGHGLVARVRLPAG